MDTVTYPLSTNYRPDWSDWEAIREIVQNALDENANASMTFEDDVLTITDEGIGFEMKHLLIGETTKDGEATIGKFGEGLKFALLALVREGREVTIQSNNLTIIPRLSEMFGEKVLSIDYDIEEKLYDGTKVEIKGIKKSYRDNFLSLDFGVCMEEKLIYDSPGAIYVKGIYVKHIDAACGYNLIIERENPLSGNVDFNKISEAVQAKMRGTEDSEYIHLILNSLKSSETRDFLERTCGSSFYWGAVSYPKIWEEAVKTTFGEKVCYATNAALTQDACWRGYHVIEEGANFLSAIMLSDREVLKKLNIEIAHEYDESELNKGEIKNLNEAIKWLNAAVYTQIKKVYIVEFVDRNVTGCSLKDQYIKIARDQLYSFTNTFDILVHEYIHFKYGYPDLTPDFISTLGRIFATIANTMRCAIE